MELKELMEIMIAEGAVTAKLGRFLQIRPKAANSRVITRQIGHDGEEEWYHPCGFYLRTSFTQQICQGKLAVNVQQQAECTLE